MNRLIVSIDGNVNTGKTTLASVMQERYSGFSVAKEYRIVEENDVLQRQILYMLQDEERIGRKKSDLILDRSIISLFGYAYWMFRENEIDIRKELYNEYIKSLENGKNAVPNRVIICRQTHELVKKEYCKNHVEKGTDAIYVSKQYYDMQEEFLNRFQDAIGDRVIEYNYSEQGNMMDLLDETKNVERYIFLYALRRAVDILDEDSIVSIEGISAVGKTSLCKEFEKNGFKCVEEYRCVDKCTEESNRLKHQIDYFLHSIHRYKQTGKIVIDNGILENIAYTFYMAAIQDYGLSFVENYCNVIYDLCEDKKIDQMIFLYMEKEDNKRRKLSDKTKTRDHFEKNMELWAGEMKLAKFLSQKLDNKMFIMIKADKNTEELYKEAFKRFVYTRMEVKELIKLIYDNRHLVYSFFSQKRGAE